MNTDYTQKSTADLRRLVADINETIAAQKAMVEHITQVITERHAPRMALEMELAGKQHGEISREIDGVKLTYCVDKKVKWDSKQLQALASSLPWSTVERVFKIKFEVPEPTYKALTDDTLRAKIDEARTVEICAPKVVFAK